MKNIAFLFLILITANSCQGNTEKTNPLTNSSSESITYDTDDIMEDLDGILQLVKSNDFDNLKSKYLITRGDIQDFTITYGQNDYYWKTRYGSHLIKNKVAFFKFLKEKLVGIDINRSDIVPLYFFADGFSTLKGLKRRKLSLIFGNNNQLYQMELYLIEHNGKRMYTFKKEIDPLSGTYSDFKDEMKKDLKKLKAKNPEEYEEMEFEEY